MALRFFKYRDEQRFVGITSKGGWIVFECWKDRCDISIGVSTTFCEQVIAVTEELDRDMFFVHTATVEAKISTAIEFFKHLEIEDF